MITISEFNPNLLNNGSHFLFVSQVLQVAQADTAVSTKAATYLAKFKAAVETEDKALKISAKSKLTDAIAEADASRDALYVGLKSAVKGFLRARSAELVDAAADLNQLFIDYRIDTRAPLIDETGLMTNLLTDLNSKCKTQVEKLGLNVMVAQMGEANSAVDTLMLERTEERKNDVKGELRTARLATDEAYRQMVMMINGLVYVEGEADYLEFVKFVNAQILYYRQQALGQKAGKPDTGGNTPDEGGDTGGSGSGNTGGTGGSDGDDDEFVG